MVWVRGDQLAVKCSDVICLSPGSWIACPGRSSLYPLGPALGFPLGPRPQALYWIPYRAVPPPCLPILSPSFLICRMAPSAQGLH